MPRFDPDRDEVLARAWEPLLAWPRRDSRVQVGLGIHPQFLPHLPPEDDEVQLARLDELLGRGGAIAVGECGLDGPSEAGAPLERQLRVLHAHFELARRHGLPLLVHCYRAHPHLQRYLKQHPVPEAGLLMHSYSGSGDLTAFYVKAGCHFSFAGPISFPEARRPVEALQRIPLDRLMGETDAPDQAPFPHRGERNEPMHLPLVLDSMANLLGVELRERTTENARRFFRSAFGSR